MTFKPNYLPNGPAPSKIPEGKRLVHNGVYLGIQPRHEVGVSGFRAWWASASYPNALTPCDCAWCPELGVHYRDMMF